jgi:hypothetical protein
MGVPMNSHRRDGHPFAEVAAGSVGCWTGVGRPGGAYTTDGLTHQPEAFNPVLKPESRCSSRPR